MGFPSSYRRADGFPQATIGLNGHAWQDQFYCIYVDETSLKWLGDPAGSKCPFDDFLILGNVRSSRKQAFAYFDVTYQPYDTSPPPDSGTPTYELRGSLGSKPLNLANFPNYKTCWNHNLCISTDDSVSPGYSAGEPPDWWRTVNSTSIDSTMLNGLSEGDLQWCEGDAPSGFKIWAGKTKNGLHEPTMGVIELDEVYYFSDRLKCMSYVNALNKVVDPPTKLPLDGEWLVTGFHMTPVKKQIELRVSYAFAPYAATEPKGGFDKDIYENAQGGGEPTFPNPGGMITTKQYLSGSW